jgi:hypothetical protein
MFGSLPILPFCAVCSVAFAQSSDLALRRTVEEADALQRNITRAISQESLEQRAQLPPSRFKPRIGKDTTAAPKPRLQVRKIVSEYSVGTLQETGSADLHEFRQVISVDGRTVQSEESARHALSLGIQSRDDRVRKRMLEDFAKHGLVDIATDYGLILLEFAPRGIENLNIAPLAEARIGADVAQIFAWRQKTATGGELEFHGRQVVRQPLEGRLWARKPDGVPLRVDAWAQYSDGSHRIRDEATVDYVQSPHGFLTPVSVFHRHLIDGQAITENLYRYAPFRLFSSDAEIKFTEVPETPPPAAVKK